MDQFTDHPGCRNLGDDVTACLGVDDDEVVVPLANLVGELADTEDLLDARSRVGDEVERPGERAETADERHADEQLEVLAQGMFGVHRHRLEVVLNEPRRELQRRGVESHGERTLGIHLAHQRALAGAGGEERRGPQPPTSCRRHPSP